MNDVDSLRRSELASPTTDGAVELSIANQIPLEGARAPIGYFPMTTIVAMRVHQQLTMAMLPGYPPGTGSLGLAGRGWAYGCSHQGEAFLIQFYDGGGYDLPFAGCSLVGTPNVNEFSDTIAVLGHLEYGYSSDSPCVYPDVACASYHGSSGATVTHIPASALSIVGDSVQGGVLQAFPFRQYTLAAQPTPERIGRHPTPVVITDAGWTWRPDVGRAVQGYCTGRSCVTGFSRNGTLSVDGHVNGVLMHAPPLRVEMPSLRLGVSKDTAAVGDTIEVTTTIIGAPSDVRPGYAVEYAPLTTVASVDSSAAMSAVTAPSSLADEPSVASALPPCLGRAPRPLHCYVVMTQAGRATISAGALLGPRLPGLFDQKYVVVKGEEVSLRILFAKGLNPHGSFLVKDGEDTIKLSARVVPTALEAQIRWTVVDDPDDSVLTQPPRAVPDGPASQFLVPRSNADSNRWNQRGGMSEHPGSMAKKSLGYKITASVVFNGKTYLDSARVRQDAMDTAREEYVDWHKRTVLARDDLVATGDRTRNTGDYSVWPSSTRLLARMSVLQELASTRFGRQLTVTGGYRNPLHHHRHARARAAESPHLYGAATDFRITDGPAGYRDPRTYFLAIRKLAWNERVGGCFEPEDTIIDGSASHTVDHVHVDWRQPCPEGWAAP